MGGIEHATQRWGQESKSDVLVRSEKGAHMHPTDIQRAHTPKVTSRQINTPPTPCTRTKHTHFCYVCKWMVALSFCAVNKIFVIFARSICTLHKCVGLLYYTQNGVHDLRTRESFLLLLFVEEVFKIADGQVFVFCLLE